MVNQLKRAIKASGLSILQISKRADVPYQAAHGFIKADRDIRISTAEKIAKVVGMELRPIKATAKSTMNRTPKPKRKR
jgi:predicted transcriptional regulator